MKKTNLIFMLLIGVVVMLSSCKKDKDEDEDPIVPQTVTVTGTINTNITWLAENTYVVDGTLSVVDGGVLTIEPGTTIKFNAGSNMYVGDGTNGTVIANGTAEKPITFTSSAALPTAGAWGGIRLYDNTLNGTIFNYCIFKYAADDYYGAFYMDRCKITMTNCTFNQNAGPYTIFMYDGTSTDGFTAFSGNTFSGNSGDALYMPFNFATQLSASNSIACSTGKGIRIHGDYSLADATLNNINIPFYFDSNSQYYINGKLTLTPGTTYKFGTNTSLIIGDGVSGFLNAAGTVALPITFTTSIADPEPGAWAGIIFKGEAHSLSNLTNCVISYAGSDSYYSGNITLDECTITVKDCTISYSQQYGITLRGAGALSATSTGNTFTGNVSGEVGNNP